MRRNKPPKSYSPASNPWSIAGGGLLAMAAAIGIGRFVYTPILPPMLDALGWSNGDAGLVASANFVGYLAGAAVAGWPVFASAARRWLVVALAISVVTTAGMAVLPNMAVIVAMRFGGGIASAFVIVCASTVVIDRLTAAGRPELVSIHFAGVGAGIFVSAAAVAASIALGLGWQILWALSGALAAVAGLAGALLLQADSDRTSRHQAVATVGAGPGSVDKAAIARMIVAYGLFGFGYVITATFLVTIVRQSPDIRPLEPWIWMLFGLAAVPSVSLWQWLGQRIGYTRTFAVACAVEAVGVAASVEWVTVAGVCAAAALLGGTFMGLTALGLMSGKVLAGSRPQRVISLMTASFSLGQMAGPPAAGLLAGSTGSLRLPSQLAAAALVLAALLAAWRGRSATRPAQ